MLEILFPLIFVVGFVGLALFLSRRMTSQVIDSTKYKILDLSGVMGKGKILAINPTAQKVGPYIIYNIDLEIISLDPAVKTSTEGAFLINNEPKVGSEVNVKYDPRNPKVAKIQE